MSANGSELFAKLLDMRNQVGQCHYDRIATAVKLLEDRKWVEAVDGGGGDESKAIDRLEVDCFGDLCCIVSLPTLIQLYYYFPKFEQWEKNKFNIKAMWAEWSSKQKPSKSQKEVKKNYSPNHGIISSPAEFVQLTPAKQRNEYERLLNKYDVLQTKYDTLQEENIELIDQLESIRNITKKLSA